VNAIIIIIIRVFFDLKYNRYYQYY
jgi:hypothetical protein